MYLTEERRNQIRLHTRLAAKEGWEVFQDTDDKEFKVHTSEGIYPLAHPYPTYLKLYRDTQSSDSKYNYMVKIHNLLWPSYIKTFNYWEERVFRAHCEGYENISLAGGSGIGKSLSVAKVACIFWLSDPKNNACLIASTTMDSLETRIWGYAVKLIDQAIMDLGIPAVIRSGKPPKILYPKQVEKIHGMFAVAIRQGDDAKVVSTLIGRHPNKGFLVVLDESTDMSAAIEQATLNWKQGVTFYQRWAIGNSKTKYDLHGALSTPAAGWSSIDPHKNYVWDTTQDRGICLYFNPFDSPAIHEKDPVKKALLSEYLVTTEKIAALEAKYDKNHPNYRRFVLGFWLDQESIDDTIVSEKFLDEHRIVQPAEWSGMFPVSIVAGLDPAFRAGAGGCVLRLAVLGHTTQDGLICLDYRGEELLFYIHIKIDSQKSAELQLVEQVAAILQEYNCPLNQLAIDATGGGRALGELLKIYMNSPVDPIRIVSTGIGSRSGSTHITDPFIIVSNPTELWMTFREYVQTMQIKGVDDLTFRQLHSRQLLTKNNKKILESKKEYITRMQVIDTKLATSPDEADAAILALHAAFINFGFIPGKRIETGMYGAAGSFIGQKMQAQQHELYLLRQSAASSEASSSSYLPPLVPNFAGKLEDSF